MKKLLIATSLIGLSSIASASYMDEKSGIKIGERLTLRPYVSLSYTYDSNVDNSKKARSASEWSISPSLDLLYKDNNFNISGNVYYRFTNFHDYSRPLDENAFGERLSLYWTNAGYGQKGWTIQFSEQYRLINQSDEVSSTNGRGIYRDRSEFTLSANIQRHVNETTRVAAHGSYYDLDYDNTEHDYATMYGWRRASGGFEAGFAPTKWTDIIFNGEYQAYWQDNHKPAAGGASYPTLRSDSRGWSLMVGLGSHLPESERISYRLLLGVSSFEYASSSEKLHGFTYQGVLNWKATDTFAITALGSSYYQPSEYLYGSATYAQVFSIGATKSLIKGKLALTSNLSYRHEKVEYSVYDDYKYGVDWWTASFGASYRINRFLSIYGRLEYQERSNDRGNRYWDSDRFRGTLGLRLSY